MLTLKLTSAAIAKASVDSITDQTPIRLYDTEVRGLSCIIRPSGVSYVVQRRIGGRKGKQVRLVIGNAPEMSLDAARTEALLKLSQIRQGKDLTSRRKEIVQAQLAIINAETLVDTFDLYLTHRKADVEDNPRYWNTARSYFNAHIVGNLGSKKKLIHITDADIQLIINNTTTNQWRPIYEFLNPFFKWCVKRKYINANPLAAFDRGPRRVERDRVLSDKELTSIWRAATMLGFPYGHATRLLLLTAQRESEVGGLAWNEIDFDRAQWTIPRERTKTDNTHIVHLSPLSLDILHSIPRRSEYVFLTRKASSNKLLGWGKTKYVLDLLMSDPKLPLKEARALAQQDKAEFEDRIKVAEWRYHDLRRTAATGMAQLKHSPFVVDKILNHATQNKIARIYNRFEYLDERRIALDDWSNYVSKLISTT
jgi:integrase